MTGSFSRTQIVTKPATVGTGGIVAAQHRRAAEIGAEVLADGGDALDAAVAVSFAMGVAEPWMSGPGGGGAMMIHRAETGETLALDFGMRAPLALDPADYPLSGAGIASDLFPWPQVVDDRNVTGATAIAVPGTVAGIGAAHARFGRMPWRDLVKPAAALANEGLLVDWYAALIIASATRMLAENTEAAALFLEDGQWPTIFGWTAVSEKRLDMRRMGAMLAHLAEAGARDFYQGDLAASIVQDVRDAGGCLGLDDLAGYQATMRAPLVTPYRHGTVRSVPELTAGPTLHQTLMDLQTRDLGDDPLAPGVFAAYSGALRRAYDERLGYMGDVGGGRALPGCTTHFSIVDRHGNMAAVTQTLLSVFGSKVVLPGTGMLMNNGIMWFDPEAGRPNSLGPGKRCLMNICPVIAEFGDTRAALGASGGRKILSAVAQLCSALGDFGMSLEDAFHRPRIDASGATVIADRTLPAAVVKALETEAEAGTEVKRMDRLPFPYHFACPSGVSRTAGLNAGCTETHAPWGDAVAEPGAPGKA